MRREAPQPRGIAGKPVQRGRIVRLHRLKQRSRDCRHGTTFEDGAVPGRLAGRAAIDEPAIQPTPVRVQARLSGRDEGAASPAMGAAKPGTGQSGGKNGPADRKVTRHAVSNLPKEASRMACGRSGGAGGWGHRAAAGPVSTPPVTQSAPLGRGKGEASRARALRRQGVPLGWVRDGQASVGLRAAKAPLSGGHP